MARAPLVPERLAALGVPDGPSRRELATGRSVTLPDGRTITPEMVRAAPIAGARLVVIGDVEDVGKLTPQAMRADGLVIEATYLDRDAALARAHGHLTAKAAARLARDAGARQLFLNHISGRYPPEEILAEAAMLFPGARVVADFDRLALHAHSEISRPSL